VAQQALEGERVRLRPLELHDVPRLAELAAAPEVSTWWPGLTVDELREKVEAPEPSVQAFAVEVDSDVVGLAEIWEETDPEYRHAGIDLFLGRDWQGRGLGVDTVRTLARHLTRDLGHHRVTIDPAAANERAIRAYERAGFKRVGVMREYERAPDGTWHDGLLMDLLADELD
jgi:aminoglycoside 6'-N-acetyltransferase